MFSKTLMELERVGKSIVFLALTAVALIAGNLIIDSFPNHKPLFVNVMTATTAIILVPTVIHTLVAGRVARFSLFAAGAAAFVNAAILSALRLF